MVDVAFRKLVMADPSVLKRSKRRKAGGQRQLVVGVLFIEPSTCRGEGSLTRIVLFDERLKVDEPL